MTRISDLIATLTATQEQYGDLDVLTWDGDHPVSNDPQPVVAQAHQSSYYHVLPDAVYGEHGKYPQTVVFLTNWSGAASIRRNAARSTDPHNPGR